MQKIDSMNYAGVNGSTGYFSAVSGTTNDFIKFPDLLDQGSFKEYTIYYVARYSSANASKQKRILSNYIDDELATNFAAGFHDSKVRTYYVDNWVDNCLYDPLGIPCPTSPASPPWIEEANDWAIIGIKYSGTTFGLDFRFNGALAGSTQDRRYVNNPLQLGINAGVYGVGSQDPEVSDFELAEYLLFDRAITDDEMLDVEIELAMRYGLSLPGADPAAPTAAQPTISSSSFPFSWTAPTSTGDGQLYKYQIRLAETSQPDAWEYVDVAANYTDVDFVQERGMRLIEDAAFNVQVRAVTTTGVSAWSATKSVEYVVPDSTIPEVIVPPPAAPPVESVPGNNAVVSQPAPITQIDSRALQSVSRFAGVVKKGKKVTLPLKTFQGSNITYSTSKGCKLSKKFKTVTVKVGKKKKKVKVQTSWQLQGTKKKAVCQVTVAAFETSSHLAFLEQRTVRVR
jgi:hypothetical protein